MILHEDVKDYKKASSINLKNLDKYNLIIIGESHGHANIAMYKKIIKEFNPEYLIAEFADTDRCLTQEELKDRLDHPTDGDWSMKVGADLQYNYWVYKLAYENNLKLIGCNPITKTRYAHMQDECNFRESYMLKTIQEFQNKKCIVQLGDFHLRSIPITENFLKFTHQENKDSRGICLDITTMTASPIWDMYHDSNKALIFRIKSEYKKEKEFQKRNE